MSKRQLGDLGDLNPFKPFGIDHLLPGMEQDL
jgi:hypothetical protein